MNNGGNPIGSEFTNPNTAAPNPAQQTEEIADSFGRLVVDESGTNYVGNSHWQTILDEVCTQYNTPSALVPGQVYNRIFISS